MAAGDAQALAACLATLQDGASQPVLAKAQLFVEGDAERLATTLAPPFGTVVRMARAAARGEPVDFGSRLSSTRQNFIAQESGACEWGVDQLLARLSLESMPAAPGSAAVVGTMRDDGIYILEWVAHYRALGFAHLFVYTNDNADGSDALLASLAEAGVLTVVNNEVTGEVPPEVKAFGHALNLLPRLWLHEWALFVDSDEFLVPALHLGRNVGQIIGQLQAADPGRHCGALLYDWLWYVSDFRFKRQAEPLIERFQYTRPHWLGKCMVRLADTLSMRRQHCPDLLEGKLLFDSTFATVDMDSIWSRSQPQYAGGQINHYWPKSFEEFAIKKARGAVMGGEGNPYDRPYRKFFEWNGPAAPERHCPPDRLLLAAMRRETRALLELPGVAAAQAEVEQGFARRLAQIGSPEVLLAIYERNRVPPGPL